MSEFDALLDEVLSHDANAAVPLGLERRIASRLAADSRINLRKRVVWPEAVAAMFVFGLLAMLPLVRSKPATTAVTFKAETQSGSVGAHTVHDGEIALSPSLRQGGGEPSTAKNALRPQRRPRAEEARIAPLRVEPLAIQPIEIAALNSGIANRKEELR